MRYSNVTLATAGTLVAIAALTASATTYRADLPGRPTMDVLPTDQVVTGTVVSATSEWHGRKILTRIRLDRGDDMAPIDVLVPGGSIDGIAMHVTGAPQFAVKQRVQMSVRSTSTGLRLLGLGTLTEVLP